MSIKKIAELSGVSPATVSRVLNHPEYKCQSPAVRERIWKAAMQLGYTPNQAARNLKLGIVAEQKVYYIGVLMTRTENLDRMIDEMYLETTCACDGLIIIGKCNKEALKKLNRKYKCVVSVNRNSTNYEVDEVLCDGKKVASMAVEYMSKRTLQIIGYVGECYNEARYAGFLETMRRHEIEPDPSMIIQTHQTETEVFHAMQLLLNRLRGGHRSVVRLELEGKLMIRDSCAPVEESGWSDYCI